MEMSEMTRKLMLYELSQAGFPKAEYFPGQDIIKIQPDDYHMPCIYGSGAITYGPEHEGYVRSALKPLVDSVMESAAAWERSRENPFENVQEFRVLAEYNGIMLAARDDTALSRGLYFVTWQYNYERTGVYQGHYTDDYGEAKEDFAVRSGLMPETKVFDAGQAAEIEASIKYRLESDMDLTGKAEDILRSVSDKIHASYNIPDNERAVQLNFSTGLAPKNTEAAEAFCERVLGSRYGGKYAELMERVDKNLADYYKSLGGFGHDELIDMAGKIAAMTDTHGYITSNNTFDEADLDFLLKFKNPLEAVADGWLGRNADTSDMSFVLDDLYGNLDALAEYQLVGAAEKEAPESEMTGKPPVQETAQRPPSLYDRLLAAEEKVKAQDKEAAGVGFDRPAGVKRDESDR